MRVLLRSYRTGFRTFVGTGVQMALKGRFRFREKYETLEEARHQLSKLKTRWPDPPGRKSYASTVLTD